MALNMTGGPSYINNNVDSPIIVNADEKEFYKQPMFYAIGHYSKFISKGSVRVDLPFKQNGVLQVAFDRPDGATVLVAINRLVIYFCYSIFSNLMFLLQSRYGRPNQSARSQ